MATLVEGRQYGLSSKGHLNENKTRILVKFTDSALRAVDELLNSKNGSKGHPTIQFHGNQGLITFPSVHNANGHSFSFGVTPFSESEGPQSIECVQQCGSRALESLGSLQLKMLIHAKEDVYEATKQRMAVAEEESKKNCTKVIKATDSNVGRKIKKHAPSSKLSSFNGNSHHGRNGSMYNSKPNGMNGYHNNNNGHLNKNLLNSKPGGNAEIQKRLFKDRVVHLLATKSYRYPDLCTRLMKDGMNDKDKQSLHSILNKVAVLKETMYTLSKPAFSEVQEDWPFYTDYERQLLKRRKIQTASVVPTGNDSPMNSHNGNSLNGSSPNSLHKRPSSGGAPSLGVEPEPPSAKRPRISHYNGNGKHDAADVYGPSSKGEVIQNNSWPESNHVNGYLRTSSDSLRNGNANKPETNGYHNVNNKSDRHSSDILGDKVEVNGHSDSFSHRAESNGWSSSSNYNLNNHNANNQVVSNGASINSNRHNNLSPTMGALPHMTPLPSPDGQDGLELRGFLNETSNGSSDATFSDINSDYFKKYTEILTPDQRARYKSDYNAEYLKYLDVHAIVDRVSKRFTVLKENLRNVDEGTDKWINVREQILRAYSEVKRDNKYQDAKHKFQVMHEKLSHIKRLIFEYDQQNGVHS